MHALTQNSVYFVAICQPPVFIILNYCLCIMALNISTLYQADAASDKELCGALRIKLDRMKDECDKLAAQLSTKEEAHAHLHRRYQLLKKELDDKVSPALLCRAFRTKYYE